MRDPTSSFTPVDRLTDTSGDNTPGDTADNRARTAWIVLAGWILFFVLWTLFLLGWGLGQVSVKEASISALTVTVPAALLGLLVWRLTGKYKWPGSLTTPFLIAQLGLATVFSVIWTVLPPVITVLIYGEPISEIQWNERVFSWRLLMGVWLYVIVAGLSYGARISANLRHHQQVAARAEALAARANLAAMRSQLQPHFLFNALHSVSSLIDTDPAKASEAMEMLGDLLRYAIRDRAGDTVRLDEEWKFVDDYISLQRVRFGDNVSVSMDRTDDTSDLQVPPFVLQPLVENSFVHGISSIPDKGIIQIEALREGQSLILRVEDNGVGPADLEHSNGTGIENLRLRLNAIYGAKANVSVVPKSSGGTIASVTIPIYG